MPVLRAHSINFKHMEHSDASCINWIQMELQDCAWSCLHWLGFSRVSSSAWRIWWLTWLTRWIKLAYSTCWRPARSYTEISNIFSQNFAGFHFNTIFAPEDARRGHSDYESKTTGWYKTTLLDHVQRPVAQSQTRTNPGWYPQVSGNVWNIFWLPTKLYLDAA